MSTALLTIIVPTYNRAGNLALLLRTLADELAGHDEQVRVIIGDNASSDSTPAVTAEFAQIVPSGLVIRHETNIGPEANFCCCIDRAETRFFWIIGDDDLPRAGLIRHLLPLLRHEDPDLLYINSEWRKTITDNEPNAPVHGLHPLWLERTSFARHLHVWTTFISGMIINRERYLKTYQSVPLRRFVGTSLVHLGWVFDCMRSGSKLMVITDRHMLATADNSTGYAPYRVFGANFARVCCAIFGPTDVMTKILVRRTIVFHLPQLIWNTRYARIAGFTHEPLRDAVRVELRGYAGYWMLLEPIAQFPMIVARMFLLTARLVARMVAVADRLRARTVVAR